MVNVIVNKLKEEVCEGCMRGKMRRADTTGTIDHRANDVNDLWVSDLMGPIKKRTIGGNKYVLVVMDVYTQHLGGTDEEKEPHNERKDQDNEERTNINKKRK